jgi:hypothetical protein
VDGDYKPLENAVFTLYKKDQTTVVEVKKDGNAQSEKLQNMKSGQCGQDKVGGGAIWIGNLPYGTYYLNETKNAHGSSTNLWFYLVLDENFRSVSGQFSTKDSAKAAGKTESTAVSWASKIIDGKASYSDVPNDYKNRVSTLLRDSGHSSLLS